MTGRTPATFPSGARRAKAVVLALLATSCLRAGVDADARDYTTVVEERAYSQSTGLMTTNGVITPLDQEMRNFYIRNNDGVIEVRLTEGAVVGLQTRVARGGFERRKVEFEVGRRKFSYDLPKDLYVRRPYKDWKSAQNALDNPGEPILCGRIHVTPLEDHLPTKDELWIAGRFVRKEGRYADITVGGRAFKMSTQGHDGQERIMGLLTHADIKPFVQQAFVHGRMVGDVFHAAEVGIRMLEDSKANDDPKLGRYLFIGDSISGNYDKALRKALKGKLNIHHPPTNCGATGKGRENMGQWLGAYEAPGHEWDVISFNFGHWDSGNTVTNKIH